MEPLGHPPLLVYLHAWYGTVGTPSQFQCTYSYGMGPLGHPHTLSVLNVMLLDRWDTVTLLVYLHLWIGTVVTPSTFVNLQLW
jgi:hypothetical protein